MDGGGGPLGYPAGASFTRNMGGGLPDNVPDIDRWRRCAEVDDAIVAVGGIHQGIIDTVYFWRGMIGVRKAMEKYNVSQRTIYNWLDEARYVVWQKYTNDKNKQKNA